MSDMIDDNIVEWANVSDKIINLEDIIKDKSKITDLFYESTEKLYIYKKINYNLLFDFIIQIYLFFEKEFTKYVRQKYQINKEITLFTAIRELKKRYHINDVSESEKKIDMFRNIINVYKHGYGDSYEILKTNYPELLNSVDNDDMHFVLNVKKIYIVDLIDSIKALLNGFSKYKIA